MNYRARNLFFIYRLGIRLGFAFAVIGLTIQGIAWVGWVLAPRVETDSPERHSSPLAPSWRRETASHVHTVGDWTGMTGFAQRAFGESPILGKLVRQGLLPPVDERLPPNPLVIHPIGQIGPYGGVWRRLATGPNDVDIAIQRITYDGFLRWDALGREVLPNLISSWEVKEEGREYILNFRPGVRWSDGHPFTVEDILFWYEEVLLNSELTPVIPRFWQRGGKVVRVEPRGGHGLSFKFAEPDGLFIERLASGLGVELAGYPKHYLGQFHPSHANGAELERMIRAGRFGGWSQLFHGKRDWRNTDMPTLAAWKVAQVSSHLVVFERNPFYWKVDSEGNQLPYIDEIRFETSDPEIINLKAIRGQVDMQMRHVSFTNYSLLMENGPARGYTLRHWIPGRASSLVLMPNLNHRDPVMAELFNDRRFRIALSVGFDRNALNQVCFFDLATPRQVSPPPSSDFYCPLFEKAHIQFNPSMANQLLDELGLDRRNKRGIRLRPDGQPLRIELTYYFPDSRGQAIDLIATFWRDLGIQADSRSQARDLVYSRMLARQLDIALWSSGDEQFPLYNPQVYFPATRGSFQALSWAEWFESGGLDGEKPPEPVRLCMDLFRKIERTVDSSLRKELFQKILDLNREHLWVIGTLGEIPDLFVVSNKFRNVPEEAVFGWIFRTPGNTAPESYSIETKLP